jgi:xylulose-5-phosphate/fructose-6-phosphate phosphoketolase
LGTAAVNFVCAAPLVIDRVPQTGSKGKHLQQQLRNKLVEHKRYIDQFGQDMPEVRNWRWGAPNPFDSGCPA